MKHGYMLFYITKIMIKLFYLLTIFFILYEIYNVLKPYKLYNARLLTKDETTIHLNVRYINLISIMYGCWLYIGLIFTSHERIFISIILIGLITDLFKRNKSYYNTMGLISIKSASCALILGVLFYLHYVK